MSQMQKPGPVVLNSDTDNQIKNKQAIRMKKEEQYDQRRNHILWTFWIGFALGCLCLILIDFGAGATVGFVGIILVLSFGGGLLMYWYYGQPKHHVDEDEKNEQPSTTPTYSPITIQLPPHLDKNNGHDSVLVQGRPSESGDPLFYPEEPHIQGQVGGYSQQHLVTGHPGMNTQCSPLPHNDIHTAQPVQIIANTQSVSHYIQQSTNQECVICVDKEQETLENKGIDSSDCPEYNAHPPYAAPAEDPVQPVQTITDTQPVTLYPQQSANQEYTLCVDKEQEALGNQVEYSSDGTEYNTPPPYAPPAEAPAQPVHTITDTEPIAHYSQQSANQEYTFCVEKEQKALVNQVMNSSDNTDYNTPPTYAFPADAP